MWQLCRCRDNIEWNAYAIGGGGTIKKRNSVYEVIEKAA